MKITDEDVRKAIEIYGKIMESEEHWTTFSNIFHYPERGRRELLSARAIYGDLDWIMAGLNCPNDKDVAPMAIWDYLNTIESEAEK